MKDETDPIKEYHQKLADHCARKTEEARQLYQETYYPDKNASEQAREEGVK